MMDAPTPADPQRTVRDDPAALLARTVRDGEAQVAAWWASTPKEGVDGAPPPRLGAEAYGELLRRQGLDPGGEGGGPRYGVEAVLGQGSGGAVWGVQDRRLDRPVAVKVLNRGGDLTGFVQEARIAASLQHPNVLPIYDLDLTGDGDPCFVMKRIDGISLGEAMRRKEDGAPPPVLATTSHLVSVFIGVCQALAFAHHRGVIHQDVKPDNVMLGDFGEVLLVDWGCAVRGEARGGRLYGTPLYMAPEQARREFADVRSDVYCLGASFFHALLGRPATPPGADAQAFWARKRAGEIDQPTVEERRRVPPELLAIAGKAIAADPVDRYAGVEAMLADLRSYQSGLAVSAWREPLWRLLRRWYQHHRAQCWTAVVALLLVAGAGGLWWREKLRERSAWQPLLHEDFVDPQAVARRWRPLAIGSGWRTDESQELGFGDQAGVDLVGGRIEIGRTDRIVNLALRERIYGNLRVEWDYTPLWNNLNLNSFIGDDRTSAYTFHVGGWGDPSYVALTKGKGDDLRVLATARFDPPVAKGQTYYFRLERENGLLRLSIDNRLLIEHDDPGDARVVAPQSVGFDAWTGSRSAIGDVRVWTRPLPERISPIDVGRQLVEAGNHEAALRHYRDLADAYAGQELGVEASFHAGFAALRGAEAGTGIADLRRLLVTHANHALSPYAWYAIAAEAQARGDRLACEAARGGLVAFPGHPVQERVLFEIGREEINGLMSWSPQSVLKEDDGPALVVRTVEAVIGDLDRWAQRYGRTVEANGFLGEAGSILLHIGRADLILDHWPVHHRWRAEALLQMGRYDEVLRDWRYLDTICNFAIIATDRVSEVAHERVGWRREIALNSAKDTAGLLREFPHGGSTVTALINAGRAVEVVEDRGFSAGHRAQALLALGRFAEALEIAPPGELQLRARALAGLGRVEQALEECRGSYLTLPVAILFHLRRNDDAAVAPLLLEQERFHCDHRRWEDIAAVTLPSLLYRHDRGERVEERLEALLEDARFANGRRMWHLLAFAMGRIDEAEFRAQPYRLDLERMMGLAKALRVDLAGERGAALRAWSAWLEADRDLTQGYFIRDLARWRLEALAR